ncbi:cytochrome c oxidase subunit 3 (plasmid) [Skermanella mucosa]|uniref:cytochrome c oxidase subunit 3 n=1 Tax=Skermanella mucosa TaxID=1789672 RepID=UPI00192B1BDD|nr:cytochrome c oxidase subunit 3 [Skermanella mucosa]UEM25384.1 cytochrome c oxidase subunit 3 [Skermanella mucosa]
MSLFGALSAKPWLESGSGGFPVSGRLRIPTARLGLIFFLVVVTVLFLLLTVAYLMRMGFGDWVPLSEPPVLWLNTLALVLSSAAFQWSWVSVRRGRRDAARTGLLAGGLFAALFLAGQLVAWRQLDALGYFVASNPANTFFYLLSALHALHLLGGLVAWGRTAWKFRRSAGTNELRPSIELCTLYWHFLLAVWLALFGLLLADNGGADAMLQPMQHMH